MKILLLDRLEADVLDDVLADHVIYRPDLLRKGTKLLHRVITENKIDAIITSIDISSLLLENCTVLRSSPLYVVHVEISDDLVSTTSTVPQKSPEDKHTTIVQAYGNSQRNAYINAFHTIERSFNLYELKQFLPSHSAVLGSKKRKRVLMVGAGIVNLITAYVLQQADYAVHLVDAGPDPCDNATWTAYGCSRGGGDARMFTLSEMDNYHHKEISPEMNSLFQHDITKLGWNVHEDSALSHHEQRWIESFENIPVWLAHRYNEDIFAFNRESYPLWEHWIDTEPELFAQSQLRKGILRLYSDREHFASEVQRQNRIGATECLLTPDRIAVEHPALAAAVSAGHIAGGIHVVGFTINVHKFMHRLIDNLAQGGAEFEWKQQVKNISFNAHRNVIGMYGTDKSWDAEHYVISPGAFGNTLLAGTRSQNKIHGVIGAWLQLPNIEPQLTHSLKLARKGHITEDANITIATDSNDNPILILGSGYGHTGIDPRNINEELLRQMYHGIADTAQKYFPNAYLAALDTHSIETSLKYCVRPWTATGLGLFETLETQHGGVCIITGGHNTGGFAQSPATAQAVLAALAGREHLMHSFYHPERASTFLNLAPH